MRYSFKAYFGAQGSLTGSAEGLGLRKSKKTGFYLGLGLHHAFAGIYSAANMGC